MFNAEFAVPPEVSATVDGFKLQVCPRGAVLVCKVTDPANPFRLVSVMVEITDRPCWTVMLVGFDEIEKSGVGGGELTMNCPRIAPP
jgi:hypothetical protein